MKILISSWILMIAATAFAEFHWEAEDCVVNRETLVENSHVGNRWNLWSTDKDADKKWSGGVTIQSPRVMADREGPEDGAPPLHLRVKDLQSGDYMLTMKTGRVLGFSLDGKTWRRWHAGDTIQVEVSKDGLEWWIDDRYAMEREDQRGSGYLDTISLIALPKGTKVNGWARRRPAEKMDRGFVSMPVDGGKRLSWRLLVSDAEDTAFDIYRLEGEKRRKLNAKSIRSTTDFLDTQPGAATARYILRKSSANESESQAEPLTLINGLPCRSLRLRNEKTTVQKVGIADLNGDGVYDFVLKTPNANIDPWHKYWKRSPETYKVSAYLTDGTFLWENDLGWAIERGIWYSPIIVSGKQINREEYLFHP